MRAFECECVYVCVCVSVWRSGWATIGRQSFAFVVVDGRTSPQVRGNGHSERVEDIEERFAGGKFSVCVCFLSILTV